MAVDPAFLDDKYSLVESEGILTEPLTVANKEHEFIEPKAHMRDTEKADGKLIVVDFGVLKGKQLAVAPAPNCVIFDTISSDAMAAKNFEDTEEDFGGIYEVCMPRKTIATKRIRVKISALPKLKPYIDSSMFESEGND